MTKRINEFQVTAKYDDADRVWYSTIPELPGAMGHGDTPFSAVIRACEAANEWLAAAVKHNWTIPPSVAFSNVLSGVKFSRVKVGNRFYFKGVNGKIFGAVKIASSNGRSTYQYPVNGEYCSVTFDPCSVVLVK